MDRRPGCTDHRRAKPMRRSDILCSHCLRRTGRWHAILGRLNVCSPPPVPWDLVKLQAVHEASTRVVDAAGAYRDEQTETNWLALRGAVDHQRAVGQP